MSENQNNTEIKILELVSFWVGEQEFCIDIMSIREIRGWTIETPLPHSPDYVRGVINLRGVVLPIVDLANRLDLEPLSPSERHVIIVVQAGSQMIGLLVNAVSNIFEVDKSTIQATPDIAVGAVKQFVYGLLAIGDRMINLITINGLLPEKTSI